MSSGPKISDRVFGKDIDFNIKQKLRARQLIGAQGVHSYDNDHR
jgi:hypothetical protein